VLGEARGGNPRFDQIDSNILLLLAENEFHDARNLAQELGISLSTVHARLVNALGFSLPLAQWVPRLLTEELKAQTVTTSIKMLQPLENQKPMNFTGAVTGDEFWFLLEYSRNRVWRLGDGNAPEKVSQKYSTEEQMFTASDFRQDQ
jgi:hypothetical protein